MSCICRTLHEHTYESNADTDMVVIRVIKKAEAQRSVPVPYEVSNIEPRPRTLGDAVNLYLPWDSCMVLSLTAIQGTPSA